MKRLMLIFAIFSLLCCIFLIPVSAETGRYASDPIAGNNKYYIYCNSTKYYMTAASITSGANISQNSLYTTIQSMSRQKFKLVYKRTVNSKKYYNILPCGLNDNTSLRLDVVNASDTVGANIGLFVQNDAYYYAQDFAL